MKKRTIGIIAGLIAVAAILFYVWPRDSASSTMEVETTAVSQQDFRDVISTVGIITPKKSEDLIGQGLVAEVRVEKNSDVEADEVLVTYADGTQLVAPFAGTVIELNVKEKEMDTNAQKQQPSLVVADLADLEVLIHLSKSEADHIAVDQKAELAYLNETYDGVVSSIDTVATTGTDSASPLQSTRNSPALSATISFETEELGSLIPGFDIDVDVITKTTEDSMALPIESILYGEDSQPFVFVVEDGKAYKKEVKTGIQEGVMVEIPEGLAVGDEVVQLPSEDLEDGMEVSVVTDGEAAADDAGNGQKVD